MMPSANTITQGDALDVLRGWPANWAHTCITSPPYWGLRDYGVDGQVGLEATPEQYVARLVLIFNEVRRVLRRDGTLWLNLGDCHATGADRVGDCPGGGAQGVRWLSDVSRIRDDKRGYRGIRLANGHGKRTGRKAMGPISQPNRMRISGLKPKDLVGIPWRVAFALQAAGWYLRSDIIWAKPNGMPESVQDRPTRSHEYIFLLAKSQRYYYDYAAVREPCVSSPSDMRKMASGAARLSSKALSNTDYLCAATARTRVGTLKSVGRPDGRNRRTVWTVAPHGFKGAHFATFPPQLITPCVLAGSPRGGGILDPFMGAGTTAVVASQYGRAYYGIELNPEYKAMAERRLRPTAAVAA